MQPALRIRDDVPRRGTDALRLKKGAGETPAVVIARTHGTTGGATATGATATGATGATRTIQAPAGGAAHGIAAVGGKAIGAALSLVRVDGRDVLLPARGDDAFARYAAALAKSGVFPKEGALVKKLASLSTSPAHDDPRPRVGIVISDPKMLVAGGHANTDNIIRLVEAMGCRPVLIPPCADLVVAGGPDARARALAAMASTLDGLVGPGGADVDPAIYGAANTDARDTNLARDRFEADFVKAALDGELFGFGICRSHQLWNAAAGGSLVQDVKKSGTATVSHDQQDFGIPLDQPMVVKGPDGKVLFEDRIRVKRGSLLFEATRQQSLLVNSLHHQAVSAPGWGFRVVGRVAADGTIEATEKRNAITVQFHPELMQQDPVFAHLFSTVGRRAHAFALWKSLGRPPMNVLVDQMKRDVRFDSADVAWAKQAF